VTSLACAIIIAPTFNLVSFLFPCRQLSSTLISYFCPDSCSNRWFQFGSYVLECTLLEVVIIGWGFQTIIIGTSIQVWNDTLFYLKTASKNQPYCCSTSYQQKLLKLYKECQVFTAVLRACSQDYFVPALQSLSTALIISCLFTTIMADENLPGFLYSFSVVLMVIVVCFCFIVLDVASRGLLYSKTFIRRLGKWKVHMNGVSKRDVRSLAPLKIHAGPFHAVDRNRAPALLKFCLQRTIFFVVKSRSG